MNRSPETESNPQRTSQVSQARSDRETAQTPVPAEAGDEASSRVRKLGFLAQRIEIMNPREQAYQRRCEAEAQVQGNATCLRRPRFARLRLWLAARLTGANEREIRRAFASLKDFKFYF